MGLIVYIQKIIFILGIIIICISTFGIKANSSIQGETTITFGLGIPVEPDYFSDWWKLGLRFSVGGGICLNNRVSFLAIIDYNKFGFDKDSFASDLRIPPEFVIVRGGSSNIFTITGGANLYAIPKNKPLSPYFTGRLGFIRHHINDANISILNESKFIPSETKTGFLFLIGGGLNINTGQYIDIIAEIKYGIGMMNNADNRGIIPIEIGMVIKF